MHRRYESLRARRRRQARRRRRIAFATTLFAIALGFAAGWSIVGNIGAATRLAEAVLPDVSAPPQLARFEPFAAPEPPSAPAAPPEIAAMLPPTVRLGSEVALAQDAAGDRVVERFDWTSDDGGVRGPLEVEYTIDAALSRRVGEILKPVELAHVVLLDPVDGRVMAYASTEPEQFPATRPYPTASLMKVVTAAAVLERVPEATERPCRFVGSPYYLAQNLLDPPARGKTSTFVQALALSNNQCFAQLAVNDLGSMAVVDTMERLGLLEPPAPGHRAGEVDPVHDRLELGKLGSGLAGSRISPLAAARLAAALVDGNVVAPHWIARVRDANGHELALPAVAAPRPALSGTVHAELRSMMVETTVRGTARRAFRARNGGGLLDPIPVAGKTGSLNGRDPDGHYEWFIGVAPADDPVVAVATLVVNRGTWRLSASQVAAQVLRSLFCNGGACRADGIGGRRTVAATGGRG